MTDTRTKKPNDIAALAKAAAAVVKQIVLPLVERIAKLEARTASLEAECEALLTLLSDSEAQRAHGEANGNAVAVTHAAA